MIDRSRGGGITAGRVDEADRHAQIASKLKALYRAVENEPVPQHFVDLLRRLEEAEKARSRG